MTIPEREGETTVDLSRDHQEFAFAVLDDLTAWLRAIGLEPDDVPSWVRPKVADGQFGCEVYLRRDGLKYIGEDGNVALGYRSVEMTVPPPPAVRIWLDMCEGKTLGEAIAAVHRAGREDAARDAEEPAEEQWSVWLKEPGGITVVTPLDCDDEQAWALQYLERLPPEKLATATLNRRTRGPWSHWDQVNQPRTPSGCDGEDSPEEQAPIDMGYMSLPVETQRAIEIAAWSAAQDNPEERTDG